MWSWVAHRITGVLTFFFLFAHVLDTALVRVSPDSYNKVIATYKNPFVNLLEVGLVGAVLYHSLNGIRIMLVDFWAQGAPLPATDALDRRGHLDRRDDPDGLLHAAVHSRENVRECLMTSMPTHLRKRGSSRTILYGGSAVMTAAYDPPATRGIEAPRAPKKRVAGRRSNFEMYSWLFMRLSGIVLVVLVLGHLLIMNVLDGGVHKINWGFVAGRWASPFWQIWDLTMLWLAEMHGANGLRTIINDYSRKPGTRFWLTVLLAASVLLTLGVGTFVIFTFDPTMTG